MSDIINKMDSNKVYTSYYSRACKILPDRRMVAISIGIPDGFNGDILRELNPSGKLLRGYKDGIISEEDYTKTYYCEVLNNLDADAIYEKVKGKCILCYCGRDKFCHRHLVIDWLIKNLGKEIYGGEI